MQRDQQSWSIVLKNSNVFDSCQKRNYLSPLKNIEEKLVYPGQIKVVVIRERRAVEYAR